MPCQFSPQKRLIRCARTIAFGKPISVRQNGWRTQLVSLTVSGSITSQPSRQDGRRRGGLMEVWSPTRWHFRSRHSRRPGCELAVPAIADRQCESSCPASSFLQVLVQRLHFDERRIGERSLPGETLPEGCCPAFALRQSSCAAWVGKVTLKERLLPG